MRKAFRAKAKAEREIRRDHVLQCSMLRDYVVELQSTNLNTTVKIAVERNTGPSLPTRVFHRIYVCLRALKLGFKACRRDLLGLDGAFMKGLFPGQVFVAVGLDSNNRSYPLAYALVESEIGQDGSGGSGASAVIGLSAATGEGGVGVASQVPVSETRNADGREIGDGVPTQSSAAGGASKCNAHRHYSDATHFGGVTTCKGKGQKATIGGNNAEASGCASRQSQQTKPAVGQDGSGGSGASAVIGLSAATGEGGVGVASQGSSHSRLKKRRVKT
nr:transposase, MuDR, MULE transposase domain protein [Tanacetum cinerariifolium]